MLGPIGIFFIVFFAVLAVLAVIGLWIKKKDAKRDPSADGDGSGLMSDKEVGNVLDLNDRFNRARYMDNDGQ